MNFAERTTSVLQNSVSLDAVGIMAEPGAKICDEVPARFGTSGVVSIVRLTLRRLETERSTDY